jgi:hypothetical protein
MKAKSEKVIKAEMAMKTMRVSRGDRAEEAEEEESLESLPLRAVSTEDSFFFSKTRNVLLFLRIVESSISNQSTHRPAVWIGICSETEQACGPEGGKIAEGVKVGEGGWVEEVRGWARWHQFIDY